MTVRPRNEEGAALTPSSCRSMRIFWPPFVAETSIVSGMDFLSYSRSIRPPEGGRVEHQYAKRVISYGEMERLALSLVDADNPVVSRTSSMAIRWTQCEIPSPPTMRRRYD